MSSWQKYELWFFWNHYSESICHISLLKNSLNSILWIQNIEFSSISSNEFMLGRRFAAALLPRLFGKNPRSHHKGATGRVRTGDHGFQLYAMLMKSDSWIQIGYNEFLYLNSYTYEFIHEFWICSYAWIHTRMNSYIHFIYVFICIWIHTMISYMNSYNNYMNSYNNYMNSYVNEFIYEFI